MNNVQNKSELFESRMPVKDEAMDSDIFLIKLYKRFHGWEAKSDSVGSRTIWRSCVYDIVDKKSTKNNSKQERVAYATLSNFFNQQDTNKTNFT